MKLNERRRETRQNKKKSIEILLMKWITKSLRFVFIFHVSCMHLLLQILWITFDMHSMHKNRRFFSNKWNKQCNLVLLDEFIFYYAVCDLKYFFYFIHIFKRKVKLVLHFKFYTELSLEIFGVKTILFCFTTHSHQNIWHCRIGWNVSL